MKILRSILIITMIGFAALLSSCSLSRQTATEEYIDEEYSVTIPQDIAQGLFMSGYSRSLVREAATWLGTPYGYARSEKGNATDCSGFIMKVYDNALEMKLPRNSAKQAEFCRSIRREEVQTGDLVFFATGADKGKVSHVGMMLDRDQFIHSSSSKGVIVSSLQTKYYGSRILRFGRVPEMDEEIDIMQTLGGL